MAEIDVKQLEQMRYNARVCMKNQDCAGAAKLVKILSCEGYSQAQYYLGRMLAAGIGVDKNAAEAIWWLHAAAEQGNANAKALLEKSNKPKARSGTLQDAVVHTLWELAQREYPYAMLCLGAAYNAGTLYCGGSLSSDKAEAQQWYQKAFPPLKKLAEQGEAEAQIILSKMCAIKEKWYWIKKSAESGYARAQYLIGEAYYNGCGEFFLDRKEAVKWLTLAARQGDTAARFLLGMNYEEIPEKTIEFWLARAAEQGHSTAQFTLSENIENSGTEKRHIGRKNGRNAPWKESSLRCQACNFHTFS